MALALYRKYRPAKFAEVVGQEHVTEPLRVALEAGRINHAYLFSGPRGCGKTSSARILARSLNCELGPTPDPCGVCPSCVSLAPGGPGNIDVTELDAASHGGVDDTRELRDRAFFAPAESRYRVFIVDEAHMITTQGFNALLKIVEEPPEHLVFVFATTEPEKVLPTIRSRTHHYPFRLIPPGTLRKLMEGICADEGVTVAPAVYPLVVRAGGGSARDSLSVLDQLLAGAGPEGVTYERAMSLLGVTDVALIDDMVDALAAGDRSVVYETVDRVVEAGHDPRRFASDLLQRLRDVLLLQAVPEAADRGLVDVAEDELARIVEQADRIGAATLTRYCEILHNGLIEMRGATAPRLLLELLCARMLLPAATPAEAGLLERLERLERRNDIAAGPATAADGAPAGDGSEASKRAFRRPSQGAEPPPARTEAPAPAAERPAPERPVPERPAPERPAPERPAPERPAPERPAASSSPPAAPASRPAPDRAAPDAAPAAPPAPARPAETAPRERPAEHAGARPAANRPAEPERPAPAAPPAQEPPAAPAPGRGTDLDAAAVRRVWSEVLAAARSHSRSIEAMLVNATVRALDGDTLVLGIGAPSLAKRLSESRNADVVSAALHDVLGVRWTVRCETGDGPSGAPARAAAAAPQRPATQRQAPQRRQVPPPAAQQQPTPPPAAPEQPQRAATPPPVDDEPLPPEPPDDEEPPEDDEYSADPMTDSAAPPDMPEPERNGPEEAAMRLLSSSLGAQKLEPR